MFDVKWADSILDDIRWLRADTFSWQSGSTYTLAYQHLVDDISGITAGTETIAGTTITFYRAADGHKIVLADQESNVSAIYTATGVAWYYILDTANTRFKLPRETYQYYIGQIAPVVGTGMTLGLTNGSANAGLSTYTRTVPNVYSTWGNSTSTAAYGQPVSTSGGGYNSLGTNSRLGITTDPNNSGIIADLDVNDQSTATGTRYLYFYVGGWTESAIQQTAGLNASLFNAKLDIPTGRSQSSVALLVEAQYPTAGNPSWYRKYSDGWVEQGGNTYGTGAITINLPVEMSDSRYTVVSDSSNSSASTDNNMLSFVRTQTTTQIIVVLWDSDSASNRTGYANWHVCGQGA